MLEQMVEPDSKLLLSTSFTEVHRSVIKFQLRTAPFANFHASHTLARLVLDWNNTA